MSSPKNPIVSVKNIVESAGNLLTASGAAEQIVATAVNTYTGAVAEVKVGSKILAFFISQHFINDAAQAAGSCDWYLAKRHGAQVFADFPDPDSVGGNTLRNQVFHQEKALPGSVSGPGMHFQGVIRIPRGQQRMREGDVWFISSDNSAQNCKICTRIIYKWYS